MTYYTLTGVNKKDLFLRKNGKTFVVENNLPYIFHSYVHKNGETDYILDLIEKYAPTWKTNKVKQGVSRSSIEVECNFKVRDKFKKGFPKNKPSYLDLVRWQTGFPFSIVETEGDSFNFTGEHQSIENLLEDKKICLDIETKYPFEEGLYSVSLLTSCGKEIVFLTDESNTKTNAEKFVYGSESELICGLREFIVEYDPLVISGQYHKGFDLPFLIERDKKDFSVGPYGTKPRVLGKTMPPKMVLDGRILLDTYMPTLFKLLPNAKLDTIARYYDIGEKTLSHEELEKLMKCALKGDSKAKEDILEYNLNDVRITEKIAERILPDVLKIAVDVGLDPSTICSVAWDRLGEKYVDKINWNRKYVPKRTNMKEKSNFDYKGEIMSLLWDGLGVETVRGRFENVSVICPSPKMFEGLYRGLEDLLEEKNLLSNEILFGIAKNTLYDLELYKNGKLDFKSFYEQHRINPKEMESGINEYISKLKRELSHASILNMSNEFMFVRGRLGKRNSFFVHEKADTFLSVNKGTCFFKSDGKVYSTGMNISKNYGFIVPYEKNVMGCVLEMILRDDFDSLVPYLESIKYELREEEIDEDLLTKEMTMGQDFEVYSSPFKKKMPLMFSQMKGAKQGEKVKLVKSKEKVLDTLFGKTVRGRRKLSSGKVGMLLSAAYPFTKSNKYVIEGLIKEEPLLPEGQTRIVGFERN